MSDYGKGWQKYWDEVLKPNHAAGMSDALDTAKDDVGKLMTGNIVGVAKNGLGYLGRVAQRGISNVVGFFKALFNHPSWYKYHGKLVLPTVNFSRPFDPNNVRSMNGTVGGKCNPGIGVAHVIYDQYVVNDFRSTDAWRLAIDEAFRINRIVLKSNLIYTKESFANYIYRSILVGIKVKQIERQLGWYNVYRGDIPELQKALSRIPANKFEIGNVGVAKIAMIQDDVIADTLTLYDKLRSVVSQIAIPHKLSQFISYYAGSTFTDQNAPNPNLYIPLVREVPIYATNHETGAINQIGVWDIMNSGIREVIDEALDLLDSYGVLAADIAKMGLFGKIEAADLTNYQPIVLSDAGYFTILINSYTMSAEDLKSIGKIGDLPDYKGFLESEEYVRVDVMADLPEDNTVAVANALTTLVGVPGILKLVSQACYFSSQVGDRIPTFTLDNHDLTSGDTMFGITDTQGEGYFIQFNSNMDASFSVTVNRGVVQQSVTGTPSNRIRIVQGATTKLVWNAGSANVIYLNDRFTSYNGAIPYVGTLVGTVTISGQLVKLYLAVNLNTNKLVYVLFNYPGQLPSVEFEDTLGTLNRTGQYSFMLTDVNGVETNLGSGALDSTMIALFNMDTDAVFYADFWTIVQTWNTPSGITSGASLKNTQLINLFCEQVDFHLPIIVHATTCPLGGSIDGTQYGNHFRNVPELMKETYMPAIFAKADIENTLYWMYLGLFSVYDSGTAAPSGNKNKSGKRPGKGKESHKSGSDK